MIAPQKRSAELTDTENSQVKKPKFVKKNGPKGKFDNKNPNGNPFKGTHEIFEFIKMTVRL